MGGELPPASQVPRLRRPFAVVFAAEDSSGRDIPVIEL